MSFTAAGLDGGATADVDTTSLLTSPGGGWSE